MNLRYNGFWFTHKALRAMLYDAAMTIQQADIRDGHIDQPFFQKLKKLLIAFDLHADLEDEYILPLIEKMNAGLFAEFDREHKKDHLLTSQLSRLLEKLLTHQTDQSLFNELFYAFNSFLAFNIEHMNKEETILLEAIWEQYSDKELLELHEEIIRTRQSSERETSIYWMLKGCSAGEITQLLANMQNKLQADAYTDFIERAKQIVGELKWFEISNHMNAFQLNTVHS